MVNNFETIYMIYLIILFIFEIVIFSLVIKMYYNFKDIKYLIKNDKYFINNNILSNEDIINNMNNIELVRFIKERFNLLDYCKMCNNFKPIKEHPEICRFKGLYNDFCEPGFKNWLNDTNNLEGDMDADLS